MEVLSSGHGQGTIARILKCDCTVPGCERGWLVATVQGAHSELWITVGTAAPWQVLEEHLAMLLENDVVDGVPASQVIEHGLAMVGLRWEELTSSADVAAAQLTAWAKLPDWFSRLPCGDVWAVRRATFGNDLTRVPRAIWALHRAYVEEAPVRREVFSSWDAGE